MKREIMISLKYIIGLSQKKELNFNKQFNYYDARNNIFKAFKRMQGQAIFILI